MIKKEFDINDYFKPTKLQKKYVEAVDWLVDSNPHYMGTGKSWLIMWSVIKWCLRNPNKQAYIWDHYPARNYDHMYRYFDYITSEFPTEVKSRFKFNQANRTIMYIT